MNSDFRKLTICKLYAKVQIGFTFFCHFGYFFEKQSLDSFFRHIPENQHLLITNILNHKKYTIFNKNSRNSAYKN
jgi:hypothetical protein